MDYTRVRVTAIRRVTPRMIRITFTSPELSEYESDGRPDEYCRVFFPVDGVAASPIVDADGHDLPSEDLLEAPMRNYTVRRFDRAARELDIDFVVHMGGVAATWAAHARLGDEVAISPSHGDYDPPEDIRWQFLVGDASALPALSRILEERSHGIRTRATVIVADAEERQAIEAPADTDVVWVFEPDDNAIAETIRRIVTEFDHPEGRGYVWVAGENRGARQARSHLRHTLGLTWDDYHTLGYWRTHAETWNRRYRAHQRRIEEQIDEVNERLRDAPVDDFVDAIDKIYVDAGLEDRLGG